jgi:hypothetical protein
MRRLDSPLTIVEIALSEMIGTCSNAKEESAHYIAVHFLS